MQVRLQVMNTKKFGDRLKAARESQGKTQQQVADAAGMTRVAYGYWEAGDIKRGVDAEKLWLVAGALDVSVPYLIFGAAHADRLPSEELATLWRRLTAAQKADHLAAIAKTAQTNADLLAELKK